MAKKLKKELGLFDVFAIASGAMISSGLFILPAFAYAKSGFFEVWAYVLAGLLALPTLLSKAELLTAMPRSGGEYFYINRSLGSGAGTAAGFAAWVSLGLKSAFALIGMGFFVEFILHSVFMTSAGAPITEWLAGIQGGGQFTEWMISIISNEASLDWMIKIIASFFCLLFVIINLFGARHAGNLQIFLVIGLIILLVAYVFYGVRFINLDNFNNQVFSITDGELTSRTVTFWDVITTVGFVYVSFAGLTKIDGVAEEIKNPGRNVPLGMGLAFVVVTGLYGVTIAVTVGVLSPEQMLSSHMPISDGAIQMIRDSLGTENSNGAALWGGIVMAIAALFAFISTGNAGVMASSRYPMAMSRDKMLPPVFHRISLKYGTPYVSILVTGLVVILMILFLDLSHLIEAASTMLLLLYALDNLALIIMRESRLPGYRPKFKAPLYPYLQIIGIIAYIFLITRMDVITLIMTAIFIAVSFLWYVIYGRVKVNQHSALVYLVGRLANKEIKNTLPDDKLDKELMNLLKERDEIVEDRFDGIIQKALVLDIKGPMDVDGLFKNLARELSPRLNISEETIYTLFQEREAESSTALAPGLAIPHIIIDGEEIFNLVMVRCKEGINFSKTHNKVHAVFVLIGTRDERNFHLSALMSIAQIVQQHDFLKRWHNAQSIEQLRHIVLLSERTRNN